MTLSARNDLAAEHAPLAMWVARGMRHRTPWKYSTRDIAGWGAIAMIQALDRFDPSRGDLRPYLNRKIQYGILDAMRRLEHRTVVARPSVTVSTECVTPAVDPRPSNPDRAILAREVWSAVQQLPERLQRLMRLCYLHDMEIAECGRIIGVSRPRASKMHKAAVEQVREILKRKAHEVEREREMAA